MGEQPNFLLIITDQQRADCMGCAGNSILRTPHIDDIAARGTRFKNAYVASPMCMPNRATLMTGRMPSTHGLRTNGIPLALSAVTFADLLRHAGYQTHAIGKMHLQNMSGWPSEQVNDAGAEGLLQPPSGMREAYRSSEDAALYHQELASSWKENPDHDVTLPYYGFDGVELCILHGDNVHGHYGRWFEQASRGNGSLQGEANANPTDYITPDSWRTRVPEELYPTSYIAERAIEFLGSRTSTEQERPFFLKCSFPDPHHPFTPPGQYYDMYRTDDVSLPASFVNIESPESPFLKFARDQRDNGTRRVKSYYCVGVTEREVREATALTYGSITMIDDAIGRVLKALDDADLSRNTIVIFLSDHGEYLGDHQMIFKGPLHYQGLIKIPMIWSDPQAGQHGLVSSQLCGMQDIAPTILERAGIQPFNGIQGRSLLKSVDGEAIDSDRVMLVEDENQQRLFGLPSHPRVRTVVNDRYRLSVYDQSDWGELYDLIEDPDEMRNLWSARTHQAEKAKMLEALALEMLQADDRSPLPTHRA